MNIYIDISDMLIYTKNIIIEYYLSYMIRSGNLDLILTYKNFISFHRDLFQF